MKQLRRDLSLALTAWLTVVLPCAAVARADDLESASHDSEHDPPAEYLTGLAFRDALDVQVRVRWEDVPLRRALYRLTHAQGVALLLDRRIDPSILVDRTASGSSRRALMQELAEAHGGRLVVVGSVAYVAPPEAAERMNYLLDLRRRELATLPAARRRALSKASTLRWTDLTAPEDILRDIAGRYRFSLAGIEQVPWDLWAGSAVPEATAVQQLSLILAQFDLTFRWDRQGKVVQVVPIPDAARRAPARYRTGRSRTRRSPDAALSGRQRSAARRSLISGEVKNKTLRAVLEYFATQSGYEVDVDWEALEARGIVANRLVSFTAKRDSLEKVLHKVFDPLDVTFDLSGRRIIVPAP